MLETVKLSGVQLTTNSFAEGFLNRGKCIPVKQMVFNHQCYPSSIDTLHANSIMDLCDVRVLDLSCLGLKHLYPMALNLKPTRRVLIVDLSHNQIENSDDIFGSLSPMDTNTQTRLIMDFNPIRFVNETSVNRFLTVNNGNRLEMWQDIDNVTLDCDDCRNEWLTRQPMHWDANCHSRILNKTIPLSNTNTFEHCSNT